MNNDLLNVELHRRNLNSPCVPPIVSGNDDNENENNAGDDEDETEEEEDEDGMQEAQAYVAEFFDAYQLEYLIEGPGMRSNPFIYICSKVLTEVSG